MANAVSTRAHQRRVQLRLAVATAAPDLDPLVARANSVVGLLVRRGAKGRTMSEPESECDLTRTSAGRAGELRCRERMCQVLTGRTVGRSLQLPAVWTANSEQTFQAGFYRRPALRGALAPAGSLHDP